MGKYDDNPIIITLYMREAEIDLIQSVLEYDDTFRLLAEALERGLDDLRAIAQQTEDMTNEQWDREVEIIKRRIIRADKEAKE